MYMKKELFRVKKYDQPHFICISWSQFYFRKYLFLYILILLGSLILLKLMQEYQFCLKLSRNGEFRVDSLVINYPIEDKLGTFIQYNGMKVYFPRERELLNEVFSAQKTKKAVRVGLQPFFQEENDHFLRKDSENFDQKITEYNSIDQPDFSNFISSMPKKMSCKKGLIITSIYEKTGENDSGLSIISDLQAGIRGAQNSIFHRFQRALPSPHAELAVGVLFGQEVELPISFYTDMQRIGLLHIVAASGYNLSVLAQSARIFLRKLLTPQQSAWLIIVLLWLYVAVSGGSPSVVRAAWMASLTFLAVIWGKRIPAMSVFWLSCFLMILIDQSILFNTSFHLSFASTLGILLFIRQSATYPVKSSSTSVSGTLTALLASAWESLSVTLAALSFTVPLIAAQFQQVSVMAIPANLLLGWLVPWLMFSSLLLFVSTFVGRPFTLPFAGATWLVSSRFVWGATRLADFPYSSFRIHFPWWAVALWWGVLWMYARYKNTNKNRIKI